MVTGTTGLRLPRRQHCAPAWEQVGRTVERYALLAGAPRLRRSLLSGRGAHRHRAGDCRKGVQIDAELCSGPGSPATAQPVSAADRRQVHGVDPRLDQHRLPAVIDDVHDTTAPPRHRPARWPFGPLHHHASEAPRAVRQPADPAVPGDDRPAPTGLRTRRHRPRSSWCRPGCRDLAALGQRRSRPSTHPACHTREHDTASRTPVRLPGETTRCAVPMPSASPRPRTVGQPGGPVRSGRMQRGELEGTAAADLQPGDSDMGCR